MSETTVLAEIDKRGTGWITLHREQVHNAMNEHLIRDLTQVLMEYDADPDVRFVVLTGTGKSFCAGGDLNWMRRTAEYSYDENMQDALKLGDLLRTLNDMTKPTVARVQGPAYGGGVGLVACCDIAIASDRAKFCLSEVKLGLIPATISPYVVRAITAQQARRYFLTAEVFDAAEAKRLGLVHEVVSETALDDTVELILDRLYVGGPKAQAAAKDLIFQVAHGPVDGALIDYTARRIAEVRATDEGKEGAGAFLEKRKPDWVLD